MTARLHFDAEELLTNKIVFITPGHAPSMVTTLGPEGTVNVATFEQTMAVSYEPPRLLIAITSESDTYRNIMDGSDCVVGFPRLEYIQQAYDAGVKAPRNVSELDLIPGLTTFDSSLVQPPSIEQCWVNFECRLYSDTPAGDHNVLLLDVLHASLDKAVWKDNRIARRTGLPSVYYTTSGHFHELGAEHVVKLSKKLTYFENGD